MTNYTLGDLCIEDSESLEPLETIISTIAKTMTRVIRHPPHMS